MWHIFEEKEISFIFEEKEILFIRRHSANSITLRVNLFMVAT